MNRLYMLELRKLLKETDSTTVTNAARVNAFDFRKFTGSLKAIKKKIFKSKAFEDVFKNMTNVFDRIDKKVKKTITKQYKKKKFDIPEQALKASSQQLKDAAELNVALISSIADKHSENLENAVMSAVKGGSNFETVIAEVEKQSTKGRAYAENIARDQVAKTYAAINEERAKATGFPGYEWASTNDGKTRPTHAALDDTFHLWAEPPLIKGEGKQPDRNLHPGEDYNCRCIAVPAFQPE